MTIPREQILRAALEGLQAQVERLQGAIRGIQAELSSKAARPASSGAGAPKKRVLSPEAIERIREGQRRRWAKAKPAAAAPAPKKRRLSAAGRKAISDAAKARWARAKRVHA